MNSKLDVSFIIINYNCYDYVKRLIESIKSFYTDDVDIIIVDNNSIEREIEKISEINRKIKLFLLKENIGFSRANNFAAGKCDTRYLVFINPDVLFIEECIGSIISFIDNNENTGACAPMLLNEDMTVQNSSGFRMGLFYEFLEAFFLINLIRKIYRLKLKIKVSNLPVKTAWISGAFLVIKKETFESVNGFDNNFFLNYEDIDLCRRLMDKGYTNYYFPDLKCIHYSNQSFKQDCEKLVTSRYKSRRLFAKKYYNIVIRSLVWFLHVSGLGFRLATVFFFYKYPENRQRYLGYKKSLKLYFEKN